LKRSDINLRKKTLFLATSKTDQESLGTYRVISDTTIALIKLWTHRNNISKGYLLRSVTPNKKITERKVNYLTVYRAFKGYAIHIDLEDEVFTSHSARIGAAVTLAEEGCSLLDIQHSGGWKSASMPARYTEQINIQNQGMGAVLKKLKR
jgi:integrase